MRAPGNFSGGDGRREIGTVGWDYARKAIGVARSVDGPNDSSENQKRRLILYATRCSYLSFDRPLSADEA